MEQSVERSDPALELKEIFDRLERTTRRNVSSETFIAGIFGVEPCSRDFYFILNSILERLDLIERYLLESQQVGSRLNQSLEEVAAIRSCFGAAAMSKLANDGNGFIAKLTQSNAASVMNGLSYIVGSKFDFPKLDDNEIEELVEETNELLGWLNDHHLEERDYIRSALIEGLESFVRKAQLLNWVGWGAAHQDLKEIIVAYLALYHGRPSAAEAPSYDALLKKSGSFLRKTFEKVRSAKDIYETGRFLMTLYGFSSFVEDYKLLEFFQIDG